MSQVQEYRQLSTSGLLGYGFPEASLEAGMARRPHMIGVDGGSTDPGPYYLGSGKCVNSRIAMKRDLRLMLLAARSERIPLIIGSCGGAGGEPHLQVVAELVREIAREDAQHFRLALIHSEQDKNWVKRELAAGRVKALRNVKPLDDATIDRATRIVGMMGPEPFQRALDEGADVVLAGRSSDPAPWAGCATRAGLPPAPAWYAGKMLECGATAALPKGHDCLLTSVSDAGSTSVSSGPVLSALAASPEFTRFPEIPRTEAACLVAIQSSKALMLALRAALDGSDAPEAVFTEHAPTPEEVFDAW